MITIDHLRRYAVARSLFPPTTLKRAVKKMGFVQADPIRAPARAQDLTLRHRVKGYHAGDLEKRYETLGVEEDTFVNYGFVSRRLQELMHPRAIQSNSQRTKLLLEFVRERGAVHPREVDRHFSHGRVTNYWGGSSNATTHLLDAMHYRGLLRVVRRDAGIRVYGAHRHEAGPVSREEKRMRIDALVDVVAGIYAPLPAVSLAILIRRLRLAAPQWRSEYTAAIGRAKKRLAHASVDGIDWYWPAGEDPARSGVKESVRLLTPFDPVVWDRYRFQLLWGWTYRFEAYTPPGKRKMGYYALPVLWRDRVIGWGNLSVHHEELQSEFGYVEPDRGEAYGRELAAELERMRLFLGICKK